MGVEARRRVLSRGWPASTLVLIAATGVAVAECSAATGSAQTVSPSATVAASTPAVEAPALATATPSPTPEALVFADAGSTGAWLVDEPLADLSPAAALTAARDGSIGVAVLVPSQGVVYEINGNAQFELASVAKLPIMLTLLDQTISEGRQLTGDDERQRCRGLAVE
jgi:beta-lactamase class A